MPITPISSWRKTLYVAPLLSTTIDSSGDQENVYDYPISLTWNVQPLSDDARIEMFGANSKKMFRATVLAVGTGIKEFDLVYYEGASPSGEANNGDNANFIIRRVMEQNVMTMIFFESIKGV